MSETEERNDQQRAELARWVVALRQAFAAGTPQGRGNLQDQHGYCCLGIWCDLRAFQGHLTMQVDGTENRTISYFPTTGDGGNGWASYPPPENFIGGVNDPLILDGTFPDKYGYPYRLDVTASRANDDHGLNFDQIADCVVWNYALTDTELAAAFAVQVAEMADGAPW